MGPDHDLVAAALPLYEVEGELGRGAWGVVLAGRHRTLGRDVAIKQLPRGFGSDPAVRSRFITEARLLASLEHPHIVPIYDFVEHDGLCLVVMERLRGGTVWNRAKRGGFTPDDACAVILATCAALHYAHERGVLHRDVKPENLMFSNKGDLKVTDFGIAKVVGGAATVATRAGDILGTPAYMAPEQARGGDLTPATDVYAVGTVLYELLSGRLPFPVDSNPVAMLYKQVHEEPEPLSEAAPDLPRGLADVTAKALEKDPDVRYRTAQDLAVAVAEAAAEAWGPGWLPGTGMTVAASGAVLSAAMGHARPVAAETIAPTRDDAPREVPNPENEPGADLVPLSELSLEPPRRGHTAVATGRAWPRRQETIDAPAVLSPTVPLPDADPQQADPLQTVAPSVTPQPGPAPASVPPIAASTPPAARRLRRVGGPIAALVLVLLIGGLVYAARHHTVTRTVTVSGLRSWTPTGVLLRAGNKVVITATGSVLPSSPRPQIHDPGRPDLVASPDGIPNHPEIETSPPNVIPGIPHSGLIGRIGVNGAPFAVGKSFRFTSTSNGLLFLGINDQETSNNSGAFIAVVKVSKR